CLALRAAVKWSRRKLEGQHVHAEASPAPSQEDSNSNRIDSHLLEIMERRLCEVEVETSICSPGHQLELLSKGLRSMVAPGGGSYGDEDR
ncbi:unnamed protein product, partial [Amoebophrya sp. A25]